MDYLRPGFPLARAVMDLGPLAPGARGLVLGRHGLIAWGDSARDCYDNLYRLIDAAERFVAERRGSRPFVELKAGAPDRARRRAAARELLPLVREGLSRARPVILHLDDSDEALAFAGSPRAAELAPRGMSTPEHILRCGRLPLVVDADLGALAPADAARVLGEALGSLRGRVPRGLRAQRHAGGDARARAQGGPAAGPRSRDRDEGQGGRTGREPLLPARHARHGGGGGARRLPLPRRGGRLRVRVLAPRAGEARPSPNGSCRARSLS